VIRGPPEVAAQPLADLHPAEARSDHDQHRRSRHEHCDTPTAMDLLSLRYALTDSSSDSNPPRLTATDPGRLPMLDPRSETGQYAPRRSMVG
jgi:hypothetical protein